MFVMLGVAIGAMGAGVLSDHFGRRRVILGGFALSFLSSMCISAAPSYTVFAVLRVAQSTFTTGMGSAAYVMTLEIVGSAKWRAVIGNITWLPFTIGYMSLPVLAQWWQEWRELNLVLFAPMSIYIIMFWYVC